MAHKCVLILLSIASFLVAAATATAARELPRQAADGFNLAARLDASGGLSECWNALTELKSCSNEIVLFFLNGETNIGPACCRSIRVITHQCWPAMLTSLGFTDQEGDILRGYCDASPAGPAAAPAFQPQTSTNSMIRV